MQSRKEKARGCVLLSPLSGRTPRHTGKIASVCACLRIPLPLGLLVFLEPAFPLCCVRLAAFVTAVVVVCATAAAPAVVSDSYVGRERERVEGGSRSDSATDVHCGQVFKARVAETRTRRAGLEQVVGDTSQALARLHRSHHRDAELHVQQKLVPGRGCPRPGPPLVHAPSRAARRP